MKKLLLASAAALLVAGPALAADLPRASEPVAPAYIAPTAFNWTGLYVGLNAGAGFAGHFSGTGSRLNSATGFTGGAQAGYNYQIDPLVVGIEGEMDYADIHDSYNGLEGNLKWRGSVTPRIGFAFDRFLPYIKAGLAFGDTEFKDKTFGGSTSKTQVGCTAGAGAEYAVTDNVSVRAEYNYTDLGKDTFNLNGASFKSGYRGSDVKAGINYKF